MFRRIAPSCYRRRSRAAVDSLMAQRPTIAGCCLRTADCPTPSKSLVPGKQNKVSTKLLFGGRWSFLCSCSFLQILRTNISKNLFFQRETQQAGVTTSIGSVSRHCGFCRGIRDFLLEKLGSARDGSRLRRRSPEHCRKAVLRFK